MIISILLFIFTSSACEPGPNPGEFCGKSKMIKYDLKLGNELHTALKDFNAATKEKVKTENPEKYKSIGSGDCYMMNHAEMYLRHFPTQANQSNWKICAANFKDLEAKIKGEISLDSEEYQSLKTPESQAEFKSHADKITKLLKKFKAKHKY